VVNQQLGRCPGVEGETAREHLVGDEAEGVEVRPHVVTCPSDLLRADVGRCPEHGARIRSRRVRLVVGMDQA
jgi:hypothetical protein